MRRVFAAFVVLRLVTSTGIIRAQTAPIPGETNVLGKIDSVKVSTPFSMTVVFTGPACGSDAGTIAIMPTTGAPPFQYTLNGSPPKSQGIFYGLAPGSYSIAVTDGNGLVATASVTLTNLYSHPTGSVAAYTEPSCSTPDGTFQLTATGGTPPYWYTLDHVNLQSSNTFTNMPPGWYNFFVVDANGCWSNIPALPTGSSCGIAIQGIGLNYSSGACGNTGNVWFEPTSINTPPGYTFSLDGVNYQTNGHFANVAPGLITTYIKDPQGDIKTEGIVIVPDCLTAIPTIQAPVCGGTDGRIIVAGQNGALPYQFSVDGIHYQYSEVFGGLAPGNYTLYIKDANGATASSPVTVSTGCLTINVVSTASTCGNANGTLIATASGGPLPYTYSIDGTNFSSSGVFNNLVAGNYSVTAKDAGGALAVMQTTITNIAGPTLSRQATAATCAGNDGSIIATAQGGTSPFEYSLKNVQYLPGNVFASVDTGTYTVWVKDANGCIDSAIVNVPLTNTVQVDAGADVTICEGSSTTLTGVSNASTLAWSPAAGLGQPNSASTPASPALTTLYHLTATTGICTAVDSMTVTVYPAPVANAGPNDTICPGGQVQLTGSGGESYTWSPAAGLSDIHTADPVANPATSMTYSLTVVDGNGCHSLQPATVQVAVTPPPSVFAGNDTSIAAGEPVQLNATDVNNSGFTQYEWTPATGLSDPNVENPVAVLNATETYTVSATTAAGCQATASVTLKVYKGPNIYVPSAFTPNGDGHNDLLYAIPIGIRDFKSFNIYNRWGVLVFSSNDAGRGWDGRFQGIDLPVGAYVWTVLGIDYNGQTIQKQGTVALIR